MAPRVITVSGPIPPERVGFTLPHEHTGISLWHIPDRWDYWELRRDEPIIVGKGPNGVAITPDGKHAYVTNHGDGTVSVITTATGVVSAPITVGKGPTGIAFCPARSAHRRR